VQQADLHAKALAAAASIADTKHRVEALAVLARDLRTDKSMELMAQALTDAGR
jgi:hypothetical protein